MKDELLDTKGMSIKEHLRFLLKRCIAFPSKLIGFKPFCFIVATVLLAMGLISEWVWFCVLVIVLFGIVGLKVVTKWNDQKTNDDVGG